MIKSKWIAALTIASVLAVASAGAGIWNESYPKVAGASYCASTGNNGVCTQTVPAGPTAMTGNETIPMDTNLASGRNPQTVIATTNVLSAYARSTALLYTTTAVQAGVAGTAEQVLATYSLPANTAIAGTKLRIKASFTAAANGNNKTFLCYFGASVITSGVLSTNAKNGSCEVIVTFVTAATQIVYGNMLVDTTAITGYVNAAATSDGTAAIVLKFSATGGTSGADITMNDFSVERLGS